MRIAKIASLIGLMLFAIAFGIGTVVSLAVFADTASSHTVGPEWLAFWGMLGGFILTSTCGYVAQTLEKRWYAEIYPSGTSWRVVERPVKEGDGFFMV